MIYSIGKYVPFIFSFFFCLGTLTQAEEMNEVLVW